jgi:hypothetical protein
MKKNGILNFLFGKQSSNNNREAETETYNTLLKSEEQDTHYDNYNYYDKDYNENDSSSMEKSLSNDVFTPEYDKIKILGNIDDDKIYDNLHRERMRNLLEGPINSHYSIKLKEKEHETRRIRLVSMRKSRSFPPTRRLNRISREINQIDFLKTNSSKLEELYMQRYNKYSGKKSDINTLHKKMPPIDETLEVESPTKMLNSHKTNKSAKKGKLNNILPYPKDKTPPPPPPPILPPLIPPEESTSPDFLNSPPIGFKEAFSPHKFNNLESFKRFFDINLDSKYIERDLIYDEMRELKGMINNNLPYNCDTVDNIYYLGNSIRNNLQLGIFDRNKYYLTCINDHIFYRYKVMEELGKGCYGKVLRCFDYKYSTSCALKIIKSDKKYSYSYRRELSILLYLKKMYNEKKRSNGIYYKPTFVNIVKNFIWRDHGVIVMNLYYNDLYHARLTNLSLSSLSSISSDILQGLSFLKECSVLHLDLKPENIFLINENLHHVVIGDFGLSAFSDSKIDYNVQTCWYRSPEVVLQIPYSFEADLWSFGVILGELMIETPLFRAKEDETLFLMMTRLMGKKPSHLNCNNRQVNDNYPKLSYQINDKYTDRILKVKAKIRALPDEYIVFINILNGILRWDPKKRYSLDKCINILNGTDVEL